MWILVAEVMQIWLHLAINICLGKWDRQHYSDYLPENKISAKVCEDAILKCGYIYDTSNPVSMFECSVSKYFKKAVTSNYRLKHILDNNFLKVRPSSVLSHTFNAFAVFSWMAVRPSASQGRVCSMELANVGLLSRSDDPYVARSDVDVTIGRIPSTLVYGQSVRVISIGHTTCLTGFVAAHNHRHSHYPWTLVIKIAYFTKHIRYTDNFIA